MGAFDVGRIDEEGEEFACSGDGEALLGVGRIGVSLPITAGGLGGFWRSPSLSTSRTGKVGERL